MSSTLPRDPYDVLGVPRDADETTIKKSFRRLARELHPDVNAHDPQAEEKFKEAAEAYEILNDPKRREIYDRYGHEGLRSGGMRPNFEGFGSLGDLFEAFFGGAGAGGFGGQPGGPIQGDDAIIGLDIDLAQAAGGHAGRGDLRGRRHLRALRGRGRRARHARRDLRALRRRRCPAGRRALAVRAGPAPERLRPLRRRGAHPADAVHRVRRPRTRRARRARSASTSRPASPTASASACRAAATPASAAARPATSTSRCGWRPTSICCATATTS